MAVSPRITLLFVALAIVVCALVNPGNFGTIDTERRLQVARSIRLGEPMVTAEEAREGFGIPGRDGTLQAWFGIGQSLVLLPIDALVEATLSPLLRHSGLDDTRRKQIAELLIAFLMQSLLTACVLILAYQLLLSFGFGNVAALSGSLALLFATTCLAYIQCAQENELLLALDLAALCAIRAWHRTEHSHWALLAGIACGFSILVRLTSLAEAGLFAFFSIAAGVQRKRFLLWFSAPVFTFVLVDRWYQWHRFGELFSTYMGIYARLNHQPGQPSYPFSYPFWKGFLGTFFSPDKSLLLFDPLLIVLLVVAIRNWSALHRSLRLLLMCLVLLLLAYAAGYARYFDFGGDVAWGHRYVVLPVQLLCLFAVPLLLEHRGRALWILVFASLIIQIGSTVLSPNVEIIQRNLGSHAGVLWNRAVNIAQMVTNRENPQRFAEIPDEWHRPAYLPFQLGLRFPQLARWAILGWTLLLVSLPILISGVWVEARRLDSTNRERAKLFR